MDALRLIAGLGNPGSQYAQTRHNAGFLVVEELARRWGCSMRLEEKFQAEVGRVERVGVKILLALPQTYMNSSGEAVGKLVDFFKIPLPGLMVVVDDADLPFGQIRLRPAGSSGGHHGLESIEKRIGSRDYPRLRVGIGRSEPQARDIERYVLGRFAAAEKALLHKVLGRAADQLECWLAHGLQKAMSQFNGPVESESSKPNQTSPPPVRSGEQIKGTKL